VNILQIFSMCLCSEKVTHIRNLLVYSADETEQSSVVECTRRAPAIQDDLFSRRIMNCLVDFDQANDADGRERYDSTRTE
jgi:hypothetical protein